MSTPVLLLSLALSCPADMVFVGKTNTCVDRYEWPNQKGALPSIAMSAIPSNFDKRDGVTLNAEQLCASVGKRTCDHEEWIAACRGPRGSDYPFGYKLPKIKSADEAPCNYAENFIEPDGYKVFSRDPRELARLDQRDPSGARGCISASGAEDMMGNVEEWIRCPGISRNGWCLAGRYWSEPYPCYRINAGHAPDWHYYETGFRCCMTPKSEPIDENWIVPVPDVGFSLYPAEARDLFGNNRNPFAVHYFFYGFLY